MNKGFLNFLQFFVRKFWPYLVGLGTICSIIFPILSFWSDKNLAIIGLAVFCLFLLSVLIMLGTILFKMLEKGNEKGYSNKSLLYRYTTADGCQSQHEIFRVIQCKTAFLDRVQFRFKWKGSIKPNQITSKKQLLGQAVYSPTINGQDYIPLIFRKVIAYKDTHLVHVAFDISDPEKTAPPHIGVLIDDQIEYINFRITLKNKSARYNKSAKLLQKKIGTPSADLSAIATIPFDSVTKTYEYDLIEPMVGHYYRIVWEH